MPDMRIGVAYQFDYSEEGQSTFYLPLRLGLSSRSRAVGIFIDPRGVSPNGGTFTSIHGGFVNVLSYSEQNDREIPLEMFLGILASTMEHYAACIKGATGA